MAVITLARQVGSGGQSIAAALADRLGYRVYDRHALRREAAEIGLSLPPTFEAFAREERSAVADASTTPRLYVSYGELEFDRAIMGRNVDAATDRGPSFLDTLADQRREILLALQTVVYRLAARDRVIFVGAGTQILLTQVPGTLRVKIVATESVRADRLAATYDLSLDDARMAVAQADQEQRDYNTAIYGADWDDPLLWDAVVNTDHLTVEQAGEWLAGLVGRAPFAERLADDDVTALTAAAAINRRLWQAEALRAATIVAIPGAASVALRGEAPNQMLHDEACRVAAEVEPSVQWRDEIAVTGEDGLNNGW